MSYEEQEKPVIKLNDKVIKTDSEDDFDKKLEEMKAEIEQLENDFSTKNLDELLNNQFGKTGGSPVDKFSDIGDPFADGVDDQETNSEGANINRRSSLLDTPLNSRSNVDSNKSESSILFGKEYLNNSQHTILSGRNSSFFSKSHYGNFDPEGDCLTSRSHRDGLNDSGDLIIEKDTLDLIKTEDLRRGSFNIIREDKDKLLTDEEEHKLQNDEVDDEWDKFLLEAKHDKGDEKYASRKAKSSKEFERLRIEYYRSLVREDIMSITEKKQDSEAPALYTQSVIENQLISEKDINKASFNKDINDILNIEIILLLLSRTSLHLSLSSDLEITRWKKFLMKFLKKNCTNHEGLFGMSQINFSIGLHELAVEY